MDFRRIAKRHNNGLHIAHDSCHLFTGPLLVVLLGGSGRARDPTRPTKQTNNNTPHIHYVCCVLLVVLLGGSGRARDLIRLTLQTKNNTPHTHYVCCVLLVVLLGGSGRAFDPTRPRTARSMNALDVGTVVRKRACVNVCDCGVASACVYAACVRALGVRMRIFCVLVCL